MTDKRELTPDAFEDLLSWLHRDREEAGRRYDTIHHGLAKILAYWGCCESEDLADETINRVARKVPQIRDKYQGDPARYFFAVAKKVYREYQRRIRKMTELPDNLKAMPSPEIADELVYDCLESCMEKLTPVQREIMGCYYQLSAPAQRESLAKRLGITVGTLRVRVFRIVANLEKCMNECRDRGSVR
jgi:RNA polymerase sigma factor (sigma-70 family)